VSADSYPIVANCGMAGPVLDNEITITNAKNKAG